MRFESPEWLFLLLLLPPAIWLARRGRREYALLSEVFPRLKAAPTWRVRLHKLRSHMRLAASILLIISLARPHLSLEAKVSGVGDLMIALDISMSMLAEDFGGESRLEGAKGAIERLASEFEGRIGLVAFGRYPLALCPLTTDKKAFLSLLRRVRVGLIEDGTAIGSALILAAERLERDGAERSAILLFTDGENNCGIDPILAAERVARKGIKIYAVGMGSPEGAPIPVTDPIFGRKFVRDERGKLVISKLDEQTLRSIAAITEGKYLRAADPHEIVPALRKAAAEIEGSGAGGLVRRELFWYPISAALALCIADLLIRLLIPSLP